MLDYKSSERDTITPEFWLESYNSDKAEAIYSECLDHSVI